MTKNTLIVSRPGIGKTQKAIEYCINNISSGKYGVYVSLEMKDTELMNRIMETKVKKNITLSKNGINKLFITEEFFSFRNIIEYLDNVSGNIKFVIVDYLQLIENTDRNDLNMQLENFFQYCKDKGLDVVLLSQLKRGIENRDSIWTEFPLVDDYFLKYIDEGVFLTKSYGDIYCDDIKNIVNMKIKNDEYLKELINTHLDNCGICISTKTIAFSKAIVYLKEKYQIIEFDDCENHFDLLMAEIISSTNYDTNINILKETFLASKENL